MRYATLPFSGKPVSRIVLGTRMLHDDDPDHARAMLDCFVAAGGTAVDTSWIYNKGGSQRALGRWLTERGGRKRLFLIDKVCHSSAGDPARIDEQTQQGLERMGTEQVELLLLHHDNEEIPAETFVEAFAEQQRLGRTRAWGGSNMTAGRFEAMRAHAQRRGLPPPVALSNQFSLARWAEPTSGASVSCGEPAFRTWLAEAGVPLFAWGSQASGFFAQPDRSPGADSYVNRLREVMDTEANRQRLRRVRELAGRRGTTPAQVALAWVWHQPFEAFGIVGCETPEELSDSLGAADVALSAQEAAWLDLQG